MKGVVLRLVGRADGFPDRLIERVLFLAEQPSEWSQAHDAFAAIRRETLRLERLEENGRLTDPQRLHAHVYALAELTAKVTYNASDPIGPFDEDSGWWIAVILRQIIDQEWPGHVDFERAAWSVLSRRS